MDTSFRGDWFGAQQGLQGVERAGEVFWSHEALGERG
jgi:hypothetical protein